MNTYHVRWQRKHETAFGGLFTNLTEAKACASSLRNEDADSYCIIEVCDIQVMFDPQELTLSIWS